MKQTVTVQVSRTMTITTNEPLPRICADKEDALRSGGVTPAELIDLMLIMGGEFSPEQTTVSWRNG